MLQKSIMKVTVTIFLLTIFVLANSPVLLAGRRPERAHFHHYSHHNPYWGRVVDFPELIAEAIVYAGVKYYYDHGYFYRKVPSGYVVIEAPVGAVVTNLPVGYKTIIINETPYYYYNDTYFVKKRQGYVVVADPVYEVIELPKEAKVVEVPAQTEKGSSAESQDAYTVNIPNSDGTYTAVALKKSKDGFIGPQGEWYSDFPSVEQLKVMYGK